MKSYASQFKKVSRDAKPKRLTNVANTGTLGLPVFTAAADRHPAVVSRMLRWAVIVLGVGAQHWVV